MTPRDRAVSFSWMKGGDVMRVPRGTRVWRSLAASWRLRPYMVLLLVWTGVCAVAVTWLAFAGRPVEFWWGCVAGAAGTVVVGSASSRAERRRLRVSRGSS